MGVAGLITLPAAGLVGAATWGLAHVLGGGVLGAVAVVLVLLALSGAMYVRSRRDAVHAGNVNDEWHEPARERRPAATGGVR
jgi:PiT family inorganic phosphate transporter